MNARFWVYSNGSAVKITLRPGQALHHMVCGPTEEGWFRESTSWTLAEDEPIVYREWSIEGADCDGRHGDYGKDYCEISKLLSGNEPYIADESEIGAWVGVVWPAWERLGARRHYDQYAEMAGY